tara:strand:- start:19 stop:624 length:606 start_codon:yes stop_codon:yes gene_type:complete
MNRLYSALIIMITIGLAYTIEDAVADVTSSGATTTQSNVSGSNTSIQGYEATTNNTYQGQVTNSTTNSTSNSTNQETAVNSATSPSMSIYGQDSCVIPLSIGMTVIGFSTSMGTYYHDEKCERRKKAKLLNALGMKVASISLMCQDKDVWLSMKMAGTVCPVDGLIGAEAEKRWQELGNEKYFDTIANTDNSKFRHHRKSP